MKEIKMFNLKTEFKASERSKYKKECEQDNNCMAWQKKFIV